MSPVIFDRKNILILGGAGFIGSNLCDELIKDNKVICVDNFSSSNTKNIEHLLPNPNFVFINHDISQKLDLESLQELDKFKISFQGIQEVYNLACPMSARKFTENKEKIILSNSYVIKNALDIALKYKASFLQFSSSVVYGLRQDNSNKEKIKEDYIGKVDFLSERACYDEGKRFAETMVNTYRDVFNLDAKIIRAFRTYGPRMALRDDQMLPDFVNNALNNDDIVIFGDQDFSSSLCYVDDIVDAAVKVIRSDSSGPYNVGCETDTKLYDVAKKIIDITGSKSKIVFEQSKLFMSQLFIPDTYKIRNDLGWMPVVTLENGLKKTVLDLQASRQMRTIN
ncbi:NAD-dependent dehydratase [Candidatus Falkowbacteria bacterium HGW-Falkowbacteria-1]|uniref:NAD-dependent dehydratase n=1 Tax=Candidatus Falkowbacteria bacterium HGW-Falkowbacteria-1 TaxID=2013768 RepID=A0A2N2E9K4_9BACT|nr:MAG: NAD-dependent dehydratase [Candidatus Falkowbacteria bacterium HGW-Falkowbacteria-1]